MIIWPSPRDVNCSVNILNVGDSPVAKSGFVINNCNGYCRQALHTNVSIGLYNVNILIDMHVAMSHNNVTQKYIACVGSSIQETYLHSCILEYMQRNSYKATYWLSISKLTRTRSFWPVCWNQLCLRWRNVGSASSKECTQCAWW